MEGLQIEPDYESVILVSQRNLVPEIVPDGCEAQFGQIMPPFRQCDHLKEPGYSIVECAEAEAGLSLVI